MDIYIEDIKNAENQKLEIKFSQIISDINKTVPVKADLVFWYLSEFVDVKGSVQADYEAVCDICLKDFLFGVDVKIDERFALNNLFDEYKNELELKEGQFIVELQGEDKINVDDLIYQSVILNLPNQFVCDINCRKNSGMEKYLAKDVSDPRLDIFKSIHIEKES